MVDGNAGPITGDETVISEVVCSNYFVAKLLKISIIFASRSLRVVYFTALSVDFYCLLTLSLIGTLSFTLLVQELART